MSATTLPLRTPARSATTLRLFRKVHLYFGLFISPALLFFAFTGAVQTLSLHESAGSSYKPPAILAELGQLHKKQTMALPARKAEAAGGASHAGKADRAKAAGQPPVTLGGKERQHLPMKIFFLVVSVGLLSSTATGIYMAYKYERNKLLVSGALIAGVLLPLALLKF